jgi:hypothetical protein
MSPTQEGPFQIILAEAETGIVLDPAGARVTRPGAAYLRELPTWDEAVAEKDALLRRYPFAEVCITDLSARRSPARFVDEVHLPKYLAAQDLWNRWRYASPLRRLFMRKPPDPRSGP